jgi:hypothetical protein
MHDDPTGARMMSVPVRQPLAIAGNEERLSRRLSMLLPVHDPVAALRLAAYIGGLICLNGVRISEHPLLRGIDPDLLAVGRCSLLAIGLICFYTTCRSTIPALLRPLLPWNRILLFSGLAVTLLFAGPGLRHLITIPKVVATGHVYWDAIAMSDCGSQLFLRGHDPYMDFYLVDCLPRYGLSAGSTTPLQAGKFAHVRIYPSPKDLNAAFEQARHHHTHWPAEFESHFSYPAGAFILPLPFIAVGVDQMSLFYALCTLLAYVLLAWWVPARLRPWILLLAAGNIAIWAFAAGVASDSLVVLLILVGWATWRRSWLSSLLMGAAIATRQNSWFFIPFYTILIARTFGWRAAGFRLVLMAVVFALINGPFILLSPQTWSAGVVGAIRDPMFPNGYGVVGLALQGLLPLWPRHVYTLLQLTAVASGALFYAYTCQRQPGTGLVLALAPFLLAWRSHFVYFLPLTIVSLWPLLDDLRRERSPSIHGPGHQSIGSRSSNKRGWSIGSLDRGSP